MFEGHECLLQVIDMKNCTNLVGCEQCKNCLHYNHSSYTFLRGADYEY